MLDAFTFFRALEPNAFYFLFHFNATGDVFNPPGWLPTRWQRGSELIAQIEEDSFAFTWYTAFNARNERVLADSRNNCLIAASRRIA